MKVALDSNVLIYALDDRDPHRQQQAIATIDKCASVELILANQVLGETINVILRKRPDVLPVALAQIDRLIDLFMPVQTESRHFVPAANPSRRHRLQYWDALILHVVADAGARWFLSEDLHDGLTIDGVTVLNPFSDENAERLAALFG